MIHAIIAKHGSCTPELLLEEARPKASPIHSFFEWNQKKAAEAWRLEQASKYLREIKITLEPVEGERMQVREFVHIASDDHGQRGTYIAIGQALEDPEAIESVLASAQRELAAFQQKYAAYRELASARKEVGKAISRITNKKSKQLKTA